MSDKTRQQLTSEIENCKTLQELKMYLQNLDDEDNDIIDWSELPIFGGDEPESTLGVWSWNKTEKLVGDCRDELEIVSR